MKSQYVMIQMWSASEIFQSLDKMLLRVWKNCETVSALASVWNLGLIAALSGFILVFFINVFGPRHGIQQSLKVDTHDEGVKPGVKVEV